MRNFRHTFVIFVLSIVALSVAYVGVVHAEFDKGDKYGLEPVAGAAQLTKSGNDIPKILGGVVGTALSLISVVFFLLMIYGGFVWMTARGDDSKSSNALHILFGAIAGMIIILSAYIITNFILKATNTGTVQSGSSASAQKTDEMCTNQGGQCQDGSTDGSSCKISGKDGLYKAGLCKSKSDPKYLCCLLIQGPELPPPNP